MKLKHASVDQLHPIPSPGSSVVLRLSPESIGRIGGEMAKRMLWAAQSYLEEITIAGVKKAFYQEMLKDYPAGAWVTANKLRRHKANIPSPQQPNAAEVHASQYPGESGLH